MTYHESNESEDDEILSRIEHVLRESVERRDESAPTRRAARVKRIAIPMPNSPEIVRSVVRACRNDGVHFVLIGDRDAFVRVLTSASLPEPAPESVAYLAASDAPSACRTACDLAASGEVDVVMKGLVQTSEFMHAVLDRARGLVPDGSLLSHVALLDIPGYRKLLCLTDAAVNIAPDVDGKEQILRNALGVARAIGLAERANAGRPRGESGRHHEPKEVALRVACLGPVETVSPKIASTVDAEELVARFRNQTDCIVAGPLALDAALSPEAARIKGIPGPVAGDADVVLAPNIDAGNAVYKALTCFAGATVAGVVAGARVPVVLTSRADSERSKYESILFALATSR